jgi:8-oxo-dGTP pyrophosphatase MutT (NUDIX family)
MRDLPVIAIDRLELGHAPYDWPFSRTCRGEIDAYFAELRRHAPALWNGRMLLMKDHAIAGGTLRGTFFETGYADFLYWRDHDFPDRAVINCFGMGALRSNDGAYLLGVMGEHTANARRIYFPAGTPEPCDARGETVDLLGNIVREIAEETGLDGDDISVGRGWSAIVAGDRLTVIKPIDVHDDALSLRQRMLRHLASEVRPELSDIRVVRSTRDFDPLMPDYMIAYLAHVFAASL